MQQTHGLDYYDHPYVSNSDITSFLEELEPPAFEIDYQQALVFGSLLHALILEPHKVNHLRFTCDGELVAAGDLTLAKSMRDSFLKDPFCAGLMRTCEKEVEMFDEESVFDYQGNRFTMRTRRKYDLFNRAANWGADIKSTTATTQEQFLKAIDAFEYDRARVFYAKPCNAQKDVIIGISKKPPHKIFPVFMRVGCPLWERGEQRCNEAAYKYWSLKYAL